MGGTSALRRRDLPSGGGAGRPGRSRARRGGCGRRARRGRRRRGPRATTGRRGRSESRRARGGGRRPRRGRACAPRGRRPRCEPGHRRRGRAGPGASTCRLRRRRRRGCAPRGPRHTSGHSSSGHVLHGDLPRLEGRGGLGGAAAAHEDALGEGGRSVVLPVARAAPSSASTCSGVTRSRATRSVTDGGVFIAAAAVRVSSGPSAVRSRWVNQRGNDSTASR